MTAGDLPFERVNGATRDQGGEGFPPFVRAEASEIPPFDPDKPVPFIVDGLIMANSKTIIGSTSKGYKTTLLTQVALTIAAGDPLWGRETLRTPVLYVNLEVQPERMEDRVANARDSMRIEPRRLRDHFRCLTLIGQKMTPEALVDALVGEALGYGSGFLVLDPVYRLMAGKDENSAGQVTELCIQLDRLRRETASAVLYSGHFPKGDYAAKHNLDRVAGSGAWSRDADSILTYFPLADADGYRVESTTRDFRPAPPFALRLQYPVFHLAPDLDPDNIRRAVANSNKPRPSAGKPRAMSPMEVAELMGEEPVSRTALVKLIMERRKCTDDPAYAAIKRAEKVGIIGPSVPKRKKGHNPNLLAVTRNQG